MEEITRRRRGVPVSIQLAFLFAWLLLIALLSSLGSTDAPTESMKGMASPGFLRGVFVFGSVLFFIVPVVFNLFVLRRDSLPALTLTKRIHPLWLISALFAMLFVLPLVGWLGEVNSSLNLPESLSDFEKWMKAKEVQTAFATEALLNDRTGAGLIGNLFTMAFMAAFSEELFFRASLQRTMTESRINPHVAIWVSAFLFSAIHMQFFGFLPRFLLGGVLGYLFYYTGSIWVSIIGHFLNNSLVVIIAFASSEPIRMNPLEKESADLDVHFGWPMVALSFVLTLGVFLLLHRMKKNTSEEINTDFNG